LDAVIACGMAKDPEDRFPTAAALAAAAREALLTEAPTPPMTGLQAPRRTETPAPAWQAATAVAAWPGVAKPPGPEAEPAGGRSVFYRATQTATADSVGDRGGMRPPDMPQGTGLDPADGSRLPPGVATPGVATGRPARGPAWRRLGVPILAAAALALAITLAIVASAKPNPARVDTGPSARGATGTGTTGAPSSVSSVAVPTVGERIPVGPNPTYIQVAPNGKFAYIANPGAGVITVLDTANDRVSGTIPIPQGPPQFISFSHDSRTAYVSVYNTSESVHLIVFIDTVTSKVTSVVSADNHTPTVSTISPDGRYLYVPNHNMAMSGSGENVIDVIDTTSKKLIDSIPVPANPHWIVFGKNGRFYATDHMSAKVTVLNAQDNRIITEIPVGETPHSEAISPDGSRLAVTSYDGNVVFLINTATDKMIAQIPVGRNPLDIAYSPDGRYLYTVNNEDNTITVIDTADNRVIAEVPTGKGPTSISVLPNGRQAYVTDDNDGNIEILNIAK
jgi:serine/threonine-protein kinase